jgi:ABC-type lipoprotein release transport system permease subunit
VVGIAIESLLLTLLGVVIGLAIGVLSVWLLRDGIDLSRWAEGLTAYGIGTKIVPVIRNKDLIVPTLVAIVIAVIASLWPAIRAVRIRPADAVRHI